MTEPARAAAIRTELAANRAGAERSRRHDLAMADVLDRYFSRRVPVPHHIYYGGMVKPVRLLSSAWETVRESDLVADADAARRRLASR